MTRNTRNATNRWSDGTDSFEPITPASQLKEKDALERNQ
jgi:hypothetical protein